MMKKIVGILSVCLALIMGCVLGGCKAPKAPETKEGEIYRTKVVKVNAMVNAYLSFKEISEANEWGESGKVYEITVSSYGGGYSMWSDGYWDLTGDTLTLTVVNADDKTGLVDAEKEVAKTYTAVDGVFSIPAKVGGGDCTFTFNPSTDTVGESTNEPCVTHTDENGDNKCDVCGEDMPEEPSKGEVQVTLTAAASAEIQNVMTVNADAKLELYTDESWVMSVKTDANPAQTDFIEAASGTYTVDMTTYAMTLTVTKETVADSLPDTFTVNCDASGYPDLTYSANIAYISSGLTFNFAFTNQAVNEPVKTPMVTLEGKASASPFEGYTVNADAKLELYADTTWSLFIKTDADPTQTDYQEAASGTYTNTQTAMTLTVTEQTAENSLSGEISVTVDATGYPTIGYSASVTYTNVLSFSFTLTGTLGA